MKRRFTSGIAVIAICGLAGCAQLPPPKPLAADQAQRLHGRSVATTRAETPSFVAMTAAKGGFGLLGALAAISEGNELVKANGVEDPAMRISDALAGSLSDKYRLERTSAAGDSVGDSIEQVIAASPTADMIIDVRTLGWSFGYSPANWGTYYVAYGVKARRVDVQKKTVVAESTCTTPKPEKTEKSPGYGALIDNGARGLKEALAAIADQCVGKLQLDMQI